MSDEIGRREFLKRGTVAGVIATGIPVSTALGTKQPAGGATPNASTPHAAPHARELAARRLDSNEFCLSEYDAITPRCSAHTASCRRAEWIARRCGARCCA